MFRPVSCCVHGLGTGWRVCPTRGDSARTGRIPGQHKNGEYAAVTRGRPAFQLHESRTEGSDTTPMQERRKSAVCRSEQRVRRRRAPTLRKPFFCRNKPRAGFFRHSHSGRRVVIPPHIEVPKKCKTGVFITAPTGFPPKPSEAVSVGRGRATERASPAACGGTRDSSSARTTASIAFVWSAAKPLPCQMHWAGQSPAPKFRAEARTHF